MKQTNLNAKLGRLNSLNRNYNAYINSNSPHLASVVAYVEASLNYERLNEDLAKAEKNLVAARTNFFETLSDLAAHDSFAYEDLTADEFEARLSEVDKTDTSDFTEKQLAAYEAERIALSDALASEEFKALRDVETTLAQQQEDVDVLAQDVSDEALSEALVDMANQNRVRQYGDEYVDDEMLNWAKQVLGVGDYYGKIDQIREATEVEEEIADPLVTINGGRENETDFDSSEPALNGLRLSLTAN
ncbi:MAG: hypothetical protein K5905_16560 [Roseibium sp.]|nr:hypothetical protein [Roseibium sp.]